MKDLNKGTFGLYLPSFFSMRINAKSFDENMTDKEVSYFIHEYVHFLQSFTTIYGLGRVNSDFSLIANMVNWIKSQLNTEIVIPLSEMSQNTIIYGNDRIIRLIWGDTEDIGQLHINKIDLDVVQIDDQRQFESVRLSYRDENGDESCCSFGAREIYECMAYIIEQYITEDYEKSPDHPYNTAVKVTKHLYPQLLIDKRNLLVICDKALMSSNPGPEFVRILKWLSKIRFVPSNPDELFYILDSKWETYNWGDKVNANETFVNLVHFVKNNLHSLIQDNHFVDFHKWIDAIFDYAIDLRKTEPMFWLDIVDNGYVKENQYFQTILHFAGSPLIETVKHEYFFVNPEGCDTECIFYFKVFNQIYKILAKGDTQCELMSWCHHSPEVVNIDATCYKCPWEHQEENGELCPFKAIWQHWGLNSVEIKKTVM